MNEGANHAQSLRASKIKQFPWAGQQVKIVETFYDLWRLDRFVLHHVICRLRRRGRAARVT